MATPTGTAPRPASSKDCDLPAPPILASIVATIGPASETPEIVRRLIETGVAVFRFNFSHGDFAAHEKRLKVVREVAAGMGVSVACLGDLQGPKIRVGKVPAGVGPDSPSGGGTIVVSAGQDVVFKQGITESLVRKHDGQDEPVLSITYQPLVDEVEPGHKVLINDGAIRMIAVERNPEAGELRCRVVVGGKITSGKGINVPHSRLSAPAITERDWECVRWACKNELDWLALSFVRHAREVKELRDYLAKASDAGESPWIPVVSKIEMPQALENLEAIVHESDGIMVARGDLGVEMDIAQVPVEQKRIVEVSAAYGKPCIVATQMLETMIDNAIPTRAEASDVANAIFDGADAVMLSAETASGKHPALVVETMARIVAAAEERVRKMTQHEHPPTRLIAEHRGVAALAHGAWGIAKDLGAKVVVCWSENGGTARYLSQNRFQIPIVAYSSDPHSCRRMALLRGVTPVCAPGSPDGSMTAWIPTVDRYLTSRGLAQAGDPIVLLGGRPLGQAKRTNTVMIHRVGDATGVMPSPGL
ncbi:MAG: pyruvate kinase [Tepidisphaera sp.]|nr:pyruvate kinase [Tepidisphaera sp.]